MHVTSGCFHPTGVKSNVTWGYSHEITMIFMMKITLKSHVTYHLFNRFEVTRG